MVRTKNLLKHTRRFIQNLLNLSKSTRQDNFKDIQNVLKCLENEPNLKNQSNVRALTCFSQKFRNKICTQNNYEYK